MAVRSHSNDVCVDGLSWNRITWHTPSVGHWIAEHRGGCQVIEPHLVISRGQVYDTFALCRKLNSDTTQSMHLNGFRCLRGDHNTKACSKAFGFVVSSSAPGIRA